MGLQRNFAIDCVYYFLLMMTSMKQISDSVCLRKKNLKVYQVAEALTFLLSFHSFRGMILMAIVIFVMSSGILVCSNWSLKLSTLCQMLKLVLEKAKDLITDAFWIIEEYK